MKNTAQLNFAIFLGLLCLGTAFADIPVHCLKHQVQGDWVFELEKQTAMDNNPSHFRCGHELPDNPETSNVEKRDFKTDQQKRMSLFGDDTAKDHDLNQDGTWTMIYDEGFDIIVGNTHYFAFSKFYKDGNDHKSDCSKTLVGWYHNTESGMKGCWKGSKSDGKTQINDEVKHAYVVQPKDQMSKNSAEKTMVKKTEVESNLHTESKSQTQTTTEKSAKKITTEPLFVDNYHGSGFLAHDNDIYKPLDLHKDFTAHQDTVDQLNAQDNKWVADYHTQFNGLSLAQLNMRAGHKAMSHTKSTKSRKTNYPSEFETQDTSDLPKSFSWKQMLGSNREQEQCGSCYIFATMGMLSARLKIHEKEDVKLSVQHAIDCNAYNQGCDGGYPYLVEKFASEYDLVPETCNPYKGETTGNCARCNVEKLDKTYGVSDYHFIGGAYGKSNERNMMEELKANGPIVASFEPGYDFMFYKSGIYHSPSEDSWVFLGEQKPEWEKVDHSVLLYGWGEENGEKFWELQNTWGTQWGENGNFRMRRGVDDSAIESLAEAAMPIIKHKGTSYIQKSHDYMLKDNKRYK